MGAQRRARRALHRRARLSAPLARNWFDSSTFTIVTIEELTEAVARGEIDTVLLAMTDMQGRLQGKRLTATHFLAEVAEHGAESCNYLLAVDVDMRTVDGYAMSSWEGGYGDMVLEPDLATLRPVPWQEGTVVCLADVAWPDGSDVLASPRQILRRQLARLAERGWSANAGTELEFLVFQDTYEQAWHKGYRDLSPANLYNVDYSLLGTARVEPLIRRIRNSMVAAGMVVEDSKGECNFGQHEINFHYADALRTADEHSIYKNGAKEIAAAGGRGDHVHGEVRPARGQLVPHPLLARRRRKDRCSRARTAVFRLVPRGAARVPARADAAAGAARQLLQALRGRQLRADDRRVGPRQPHVLAARRRPRAGAALREPRRRRRPEPVSRAERDHRLGPARDRRAASSSSRRSRAAPTRPSSARTCRRRWRTRASCSPRSDVAREAFGEEVVAHYLNAADVELETFQSAVTDWERVRGFERL